MQAIAGQYPLFRRNQFVYQFNNTVSNKLETTNYILHYTHMQNAE
jgi:hypothetical protein